MESRRILRTRDDSKMTGTAPFVKRIRPRQGAGWGERIVATGREHDTNGTGIFVAVRSDISVMQNAAELRGGKQQAKYQRSESDGYHEPTVNGQHLKPQADRFRSDRQATDYATDPTVREVVSARGKTYSPSMSTADLRRVPGVGAGAIILRS